MTETYNTILIILIVIITYTVTWIMAKRNHFSLASHRKLWNILLAGFFLLSSILGIVMAISIDNNHVIGWYRNVLWLHVEFGIAMAIISFFHFFRHLSYYTCIIKNASKRNNEK